MVHKQKRLSDIYNFHTLEFKFYKGDNESKMNSDRLSSKELND